MDLQPATRSTASGDVYDQLVASIVAGEAAPGSTIPSERTLAEGLGVSRPVVREALKRLAQAGLVSIRQGGATTVADYRRTAGPDLLRVLLTDRQGNLQLEVARSIIEARSDLGPPVVASAARRATPADLAALRDQVHAMRAADDLLELQRLALDFWDRVVDASHNVVHRLLFNALRTAYEPVMGSLAALMQAEFRNVDGYEAVLGALERRDPDGAAAAVRELVDHGASAIVTMIDDLLTAPATEREDMA